MSVPNTNFDNEKIHKLFKNSKRIFFIGIGGISVSSLASYCVFLGKEVFGCDKVRSKESKKLESIAKIKYYSTPDNINDMDLVIYSTAIDKDNFEYVSARKKSIPLISRANFLGYIISLHKTKIGICGTHGKSTTVSMLAKIFTYAKRKPTVFCGAEMKEFSSPYIFGDKDVCIYEGCEYLNSFLSMPKTDGGILNIEYDHPDFFPSLDSEITSFQAYIENAERAYINIDDPACQKISHKNIITYGLNGGCYQGKIIHSPDKNKFSVYKNGNFLGDLELKFFGNHFVYDALCAYAISYENNISHEEISCALSDFEGTARRLELIKKTDTPTHIFEDYGHHPTEIRATLSSLRQMGYKNILCIFQAHTYSRTFHLYNDFMGAFKDCDTLVALPIYPAREKNTFPLSDEQFAKDIGATFVGDFCQGAKIIKEFKGDACVIMGAGDITNIKKLL